MFDFGIIDAKELDLFGDNIDAWQVWWRMWGLMGFIYTRPHGETIVHLELRDRRRYYV